MPAVPYNSSGGVISKGEAIMGSATSNQNCEIIRSECHVSFFLSFLFFFSPPVLHDHEITLIITQHWIGSHWSVYNKFQGFKPAATSLTIPLKMRHALSGLILCELGETLWIVFWSGVGVQVYWKNVVKSIVMVSFHDENNSKLPKQKRHRRK